MNATAEKLPTLTGRDLLAVSESEAASKSLVLLEPLAATATAYLQTAEGFVCDSDTALAEGGDFVVKLRRHKKRLDEERKKLVDPLNKVVKSINAGWKPSIDGLDGVIKVVQRKLDDYVAAKRRLEMKRQAEEAEAARCAEKEAKAAAERMRSQGAEETAEAVEAQAAKAVEQASAPVKVAPTRSEDATTSTRAVWKAEVVDIKALCAAIAAGRLPADIIAVRQSEIDDLARMVEQEQTKDGLRFFEHVTAVAR